MKGAVEWKDGWRVLWSGRMGEGCCGVEGWVKVLWSRRMGGGCCGVEGWVKGAVEWKDG